MQFSRIISELQSIIVGLYAQIKAFKQEILTLKDKIKSLEQEKAEMQSRLNQSSKNSHKPPSSDGYTKPKSSPQKDKKANKKVGGQAGHKGKSLEMVGNPDKVSVHIVPHCKHCGKNFGEQDVIGIVGKRQVFDLPVTKLAVTEHQIGVCYCCGERHLGTYPDAVKAPVQYGSRIGALSSLLNTDYRLPFHKISQLFADVFGCSWNESTAVSANLALYKSLAKVEDNIQECLLKSELVHFDETGMRVQGSLHWFHTACNAHFCYLYVHAKRGGEAFEDEASLLKDFQNRAVHDCWSSYFTYQACSHALCNAHIVRELQALIDQQRVWAGKMQKLLLDLHQNVEDNGQICTQGEDWLKKYQKICEQADDEEPLPEKRPRGKPKNSKGRNLLNRLVKYQDEVLAFAFHKEVPFTNNLAEQAIRTIKVKQKVSMSFRTLDGAKIYARIQGCITTIRKQGLNIFEAIIQAKKGKDIVFQAT